MRFKEAELAYEKSINAYQCYIQSQMNTDLSLQKTKREKHSLKAKIKAYQEKLSNLIEFKKLASENKLYPLLRTAYDVELKGKSKKGRKR